MRSFLKYLIILPALGSIISCTKYLDEVPLSKMAPENFYKTPEEGITSVNAAYQSMKDNFISRSYGVNVFLDNLADFNNAPPANFGSLQNNSLSASDVHNQNWWKRSYATIGACNITIGRVEDSDIVDEMKKRIVGEARFLRALNYFYIVRVWGPAPLKLTLPQASDDMNLPRSPIDDIYNAIIDDLKYAEENCWNVGESRTVESVSYINDKGRATKGAAKALLAKVYLTIASTAKASQKRTDPPLINANTGQVDGLEAYKAYNANEYYNLCIQKCDEIEPLGYALNPDYMANFDTKNKNSIESLFEIQAFGELGYGSRLAPFYSPPNSGLYGGTWGGTFGVHQAFIKSSPFKIVKEADFQYRLQKAGDPASDVSNFAFDVSDSRYKNGFVHAYTDRNNNRSFQWDAGTGRYIAQGGANAKFYTAKYIDREGTIHDNNSNNYILLRFADVLLMKAECLFETGDWNGAWDLITTVHTRNGNQNQDVDNLFPADYASWITNFKGNSDEEKFREAILYERFIELIYEGHRFFDLCRLGMLEEKCAVLGRARTRKGYYLPISQEEITSNQRISERDNNPGYETAD